MNTIQEILQTPQGVFAVFIFVFGGCLVAGVILVVMMDKDFRHMMSELFLGGIKCKACKRRIKSDDWIHWTDKKGETDYTGYVWCPFCKWKHYTGFADRCF